jgi:hypothetical protein
MPYVYCMDVSPEVIYIIRHAEKPLKPPLSGVDFAGGRNEHSLLPRGWQRSGALAALFHPEFGPMRAGGGAAVIPVGNDAPAQALLSARYPN